MIDYSKLSKEDLIELKEVMARNLLTLQKERESIAGRLEDKQEEMRQLEEVEMLIGLAESAIEYIDEKIKEKNI